MDSSESISVFYSIIPDEIKKWIFAASNLKKPSKLIWITVSFTLTLIVGLIRYLTGPELAFSIFYIFPVILVTWKVGT